MKGSYFGFGSPQQQVDMHAKSKTRSLSYNMHFTLLAQRFIFPRLRGVICSDWSDWSHFYFFLPVMPDKAAFVSTVLLCVQSYRGNSSKSGT